MRSCWIVLAVALFAAVRPSAVAQDGAEMAMSLRPNVVAIEAEWHDGTMREGFGFVVGQRGRTAYIATARHILHEDRPNEGARSASIRFFGLPIMETFEATILPLQAQSIDLGVLSVEWSAGPEWVREALASSDHQLGFGTPVWFIGREGEWYVPAQPGAFNRYIRVDRSIRVDNLPARVGTSGAPLLTHNGIVGMIVRAAPGVETMAVPIAEIRFAIQEWQLPFDLIHATPARENFILAQSGVRHNGAFLRVDISEAGMNDTKINISIECRKNWTGQTAASASVIIVNSHEGQLYDFSISCQAHGPGDSGVRQDINDQTIFLRDITIGEAIESTAVAAKLSRVGEDFAQQAYSPSDSLIQIIRQHQEDLGNNSLKAQAWELLENQMVINGYNFARIRDKI